MGIVSQIIFKINSYNKSCKNQGNLHTLWQFFTVEVEVAAQPLSRYCYKLLFSPHPYGRGRGSGHPQKEPGTNVELLVN